MSTWAKTLKRAPQMGLFFKFIVICNVFASVVHKRPFFLFFSTFLVGFVCTTCRGWRTHCLQWGDATVHAKDTSRELSLWPSLWKLLSTGVAHFSSHAATADLTAVCLLCDLDSFCVWTLHGNAWPPPTWSFCEASLFQLSSIREHHQCSKMSELEWRPICDW